MYRAIDVAYFFLNLNEMKRNMFDEDTDLISNLKLQKLLYYAQSAYLAIKNEKLFSEEIYAWKHGPVVQEIYDCFKRYHSKGIDKLNDWPHEEIRCKETINILENVYNVFGAYSAWGLRNLTHTERPWKETGINSVISTELMEQSFKDNYIDD